MPPRFLTIRFVEAYHRRIIDVFGGTHGVRDRGLLESALAQPEASFAGEFLHATIEERAAAYCFDVAKNHPFLDGNKRIAAICMGTFLDLNGHPLQVDEVDLYQTVMAVAGGQLDKAGLTSWLRARLGADEE
jgi:death-on-curing protein